MGMDLISPNPSANTSKWKNAKMFPKQNATMFPRKNAKMFPNKCPKRNAAKFPKKWPRKCVVTVHTTKDPLSQNSQPSMLSQNSQPSMLIQERQPHIIINTLIRSCCCTLTFRILHFRVYDILKCKILLIDFLNELSNFLHFTATDPKSIFTLMLIF